MKTIYIAVFLFVIFGLTINSPLFSQDLEQIKNQKPITVSGSASVQGQIYSMDGAPARQPWNSYIINGSPTINIYGIQFPLSFTLSNNQRDFRQPLNQIGASPTYKWLKLHGGYRSVTFSQFGLAGQMLLGGGFELTPKKFRFSVMYGRAYKAIKEDTTKTITNNLNSINYPSYKRMVMSAKLGYGSSNNFFDLYFLKGKDDSTSLEIKPQKTEVLPGENFVLGFVHKFSFFKRKLEWQSEGAASAFTRDVTAMKYDMTTVKQADLISKIITPNFSTALYGAIESQVKYKHKYFSLGGKYRRIEPDYKSMGAYFFQSDLEQITGNFTARLLKSKINLNGSYGIQNDNVSRKKLATTSRTIYSFIANFNINKNFGVDFNLSNYGTSQRAGTKSLSDTTRINQISQSFTISPRYMFQKETRVHSLFLIFGQQALNDRNTFTSTNSEMTMLFTNLNYSLTNTESKISYIGGINYNKSITTAGSLEMNGLNLGSSKSWLDDKMSSDLTIVGNLTKFNGESNGFLTTLSSGHNYILGKKQNLRLQLNWLINHSKNEQAGKSFNEFTAMLQYRITF